MNDYRADDADGLTEEGIAHVLDWLHNIKEGQVALRRDAVMCNLLAYEMERLQETLQVIEHEVALVYDHLTGGKFSKANTIAQHVIDAAEESQKEWTDELIKEAVEESEARWNQIKADPEGARHLLRLLMDGKWAPDGFDTMIDRIIAEKEKENEEGNEHDS